MILQSLVNYYAQLRRQNKICEDGWMPVKVSYAITIDRDGHLRGITNIQREEQRGKKSVLAPTQRNVPFQKGRARAISPYFMCDNAKYLLGAWKEVEDKTETEKNKKNARECFEASVTYHKKLLGNMEDELSRSICLFFETWDFEQEKNTINVELDALLEAPNLIFRSFETSEELQNHVAIQNVWNKSFIQKENVSEGRCLVTGKMAPIARLHPLLKGVRGAQSSGAALVSFNGSAFESYGKVQGENAPVSEDAAGAYGKALNYLLSNPRHYRVMGDTTVVFWAENAEDVYADLMSVMLGEMPENEEDHLLRVMNKLAKGEPVAYEDIELKPEAGFCILGLSPNAARLSVRFFYKDTFGKLIKNINSHYQRLEIVKPKYVEKQYLSVQEILFETVNKNATKKQIQPVLVGAFMRSVLEDVRYPSAILAHIIIRIRADREINWKRAAILKAYLIKNCDDKKGVVDHMQLNETTDNIPYTLGRIFALLEQIQEAASPSVNTTIKDRYFNSACATPELVFPKLLKLKNNHMRVLAREKKGLQIDLDKQLTELMSMLHESFPKQLSSEEQGVFFIGYYHQTQKRYKRRQED